ncbi:TPA: hypothetical protein KN209_000915 [Clostridioides difficile]|uniref:Phage protein n=1 Tax=Clostridioides difficile TaxID=1496 RepID=A0A9P3YPU2_CLODI|nr:hypothetical protein [Clostridioides difficile]EQG74364.1 hypothetical protein QKA_3958 [Clostridioides difficile DA00165]OFU06930.1 hypothetical protein HMPREF3081_13890 [Clostridium sp. HMSC19D02]OFU08342.1 hypothetical protein HMPREF3083_03965 [Clostridium sp. HMSC19D07]OFU30123.1 hypothetical protein HMPREF3075_10865 [Clostridium sp. HMSC19B11]AWH78794.1 hypothetical protein DDG61_16885 [Clostridioides difficile]
MELKTIRITFTVSSETSEDDLRKLCKDYMGDEYVVNDEGDFEISFYLNTVLGYNEVLYFMELIHMELEKSITLLGIRYKGIGGLQMKHILQEE